MKVGFPDRPALFFRKIKSDVLCGREDFTGDVVFGLFFFLSLYEGKEVGSSCRFFLDKIMVKDMKIVE